MIRKLEGEKACPSCGCMFISKEGDDKCKACMNLPATAGPKEKFIYQDVKRSEIEKKLNLLLDKMNRLLVILGHDEPEDKPKGYKKECVTCGEPFVATHVATKYCDKCKNAK